ncbi:uncharacterized protein [Littorina saxatilis]|uniref:uncharacterized protein n=1 Tax=Littorina saxatilis TaxID=31220 RepID=UPI0038B67390
MKLSFIEGEEEAGLSLVLFGVQNSKVIVDGFGSVLTHLRTTKAGKDLLLQLNKEDAAEVLGKSRIDRLRTKAAHQMCSVARRDLGKRCFPYSKVKSGIYRIRGCPDSLLPLKPPSKMSIKELEGLLASNISIRRMPRQAESTATQNIPVSPGLLDAEPIRDLGELLMPRQAESTATQNIPVSPGLLDAEPIRDLGELLMPRQAESTVTPSATQNIPVSPGLLDAEPIRDLGELLNKHSLQLVDKEEAVQVWNIQVPLTGYNQATDQSGIDKASISTVKDKKHKKTKWTPAMREALAKKIGPLDDLVRVPGKSTLESFLKDHQDSFPDVRSSDLYNFLYKEVNKKQ